MKVVFLTAILTHYRIEFHERVRGLLSAKGVEYLVMYGQPTKAESLKGDTRDLPWGKKIHNLYIGILGKHLTLQPVFRELLSADLCVLGQENKLLINYLLQSVPRRLRPKIGLWGHGRNFQAANRDGLAERWKSYWLKKCDWWFAYTDDTAEYVASKGFPSDKITSFNNSVDVGAMRDAARDVRDDERDAIRHSAGICGANAAIYIGGIYEHKRMQFLIEASHLVRDVIPDFELIIIGSGPDAHYAEAAAEASNWIHYMGPKFGRDKVVLASLGKAMLMPGLVGLAVLDSFALGLPLVTTDYQYHSPEIAYLKDGQNGVLVEHGSDPNAYASAVIKLLLDDNYRQRLSICASKDSEKYSIEAMAANFASGVFQALGIKETI